MLPPSDSAAGSTAAPAPDSVRAALARVLASDEFATSARLRDMLRFLVDETLAGRAGRLKGYRIAVEVFGRGAGFDADTDSLVRIQAGRLRRALDRYYAGAGAGDALRIEIAKGAYVPAFVDASAAAVSEAAAVRRPGFGQPVVAVLPFQSPSSDPEQRYFAEGLAAELTLALARFDGIAVIARQSSLHYRDEAPDLPRIGRELGAGYLVLGSVQRSSTALSIDASVTDAASQEVLWAERYAIDLVERDLFTVQDDIAQQVSARIAGHYGAVLRDPECDAQGRRSTVPGAYEAVLHFHHFVAVHTAEAQAKARGALERAVVLDPDYALAWAMLAELLVNDFVVNPDAPAEQVDRALSLASRAAALEPTCQHARWALAWTQFIRRDLPEFRAELKRAIALNPNAPNFLSIAGWASALAGDWARGLELLDRGIALNPHFPRWFHFAHYMDCYRRGDFDGALAQARQLGPADASRVLALEAAALARLGRTDEARAKAAEVAAVDPAFHARGKRIVQAFLFDAALGEDLLAALAEAGVSLD